MAEIGRRLNEADAKPRYGELKEWTDSKIYELFRTMGVHKTRTIVSDSRYSKHEAYRIAYQLRSEGLSLPFIANELNLAGLRPLKAAAYRWYSVQDLLRSAVYHDRSTPRGMALYLKEEGLSLREIGSTAGTGWALSEAGRSVVPADGEADDGELGVIWGDCVGGGDCVCWCGGLCCTGDSVDSRE
jgi:hypothetical protein